MLKEIAEVRGQFEGVSSQAARELITMKKALRIFTFFQWITTIILGVKQDQRSFLQRTFWRTYESNDNYHQTGVNLEECSGIRGNWVLTAHLERTCEL